jgi:hypothetical protein
MGIGGCERNNEISQKTIGSFLGKLESLHLTNEYIFPEWLTNKINVLETESGKDINIIKVKIYLGEWNGQKIYFVRNYLSSCGFCEVYYEDGKQVVWAEEDITTDSFCLKSKNWELIYEYGNGIY